ncbi:MAG: hypothetical protein QNJ44_10245 [Rhodobacter sp.]|nr:hypothetical protein [Rhodobacter sp.]
MKNYILPTLVALATAAPAVAQTQLERSIGAEAGQFTLAEQVRLASNQDESVGERFTYLVNSDDSLRYSTKGTHNARAQAIFDRLADEQSGNF